MLPPKIDLTANRDFGGGRFDDFTIDIPIALYDDEVMSSDEYEALCKYESFFGRRTHKNQARQMLGVLYDAPIKDLDAWRQTCLRCGKRLVPWNNFGGICRECDGEISQSSGFWNIPWLSYNSQDVPRATDSPMDIFSLR